MAEQPDTEKDLNGFAALEAKLNELREEAAELLMRLTPLFDARKAEKHRRENVRFPETEEESHST